MSFTVKNRKLKKTVESILRLEEYDMKRSTGFKVAIISEDIQQLWRKFNEHHSDLLEDHAEKDDEGEVLPVKDDDGNVVEGQIHVEDPEAFQEELNDFLDVENEIMKSKIPLEEFPETIKPGILRGCLPLIESEGDKLVEKSSEEKEEESGD